MNVWRPHVPTTIFKMRLNSAHPRGQSLFCRSVMCVCHVTRVNTNVVGVYDQTDVAQDNALCRTCKDITQAAEHEWL